MSTFPDLFPLLIATDVAFPTNYNNYTNILPTAPLMRSMKIFPTWIIYSRAMDVCGSCQIPNHHLHVSDPGFIQHWRSCGRQWPGLMFLLLAERSGAHIVFCCLFFSPLCSRLLSHCAFRDVHLLCKQLRLACHLWEVWLLWPLVLLVWLLDVSRLEYEAYEYCCSWFNSNLLSYHRQT